MAEFSQDKKYIMWNNTWVGLLKKKIENYNVIFSLVKQLNQCRRVCKTYNKKSLALVSNVKHKS